MSEFWDKINADYVARGGVLRPEVWRAPQPTRKRGGPGFLPGSAQNWQHGPDRSLSPQQDQEARQMYEAGSTIAEVAEHFKIGKTTARDAILRAGGQMRRRQRKVSVRLTTEQRAELARRYAAGEMLVPLCEEYGISRTLATRIVHQQGGRIRTKSESRRLVLARRNQPGE